jgi:hypothetical protein
MEQYETYEGRRPTVEELDSIETLLEGYRPDHVTVWDNYVSDGPGYVGWVAVTVGGNPDYATTFTKTQDGFIEVCAYPAP